MRILKGVAALLLLLAAVVGLPYALAVLGGYPFPDQLSLAAVQHALLTPDTGGVLIGLVTIIGWVAWIVFAVSVLAELLTVLSKQRIRVELPGLQATQRAAGTLLLLVIAMAAITPQPPPAAAQPTATPAAPPPQVQTVNRPTPPAPTAATPTTASGAPPGSGDVGALRHRALASWHLRI